MNDIIAPINRPNKTWTLENWKSMLCHVQAKSATLVARPWNRRGCLGKPSSSSVSP